MLGLVLRLPSSLTLLKLQNNTQNKGPVGLMQNKGPVGLMQNKGPVGVIST